MNVQTQPLLVAGCNRKWTEDGLDQIAKAFRMWHGKGRHDTLAAARLKRYKASGKEPKGPKRWLSFEALIFAATLVKNDDDRTRLRALLNIDEPMQQLPTAEERAAAAEVRATTAEAERDAALLDAAAQKPLKETAKRLREHLDTQKATVRAAKAAAKEQVKEAKAAAKEALQEALQERGAALEEAAAARLEERELELQAEHGYLLQQQRKALNVARARARDAEAAEARAERRVTKLQKELAEKEADEEEAAEEEDLMDEDDRPCGHHRCRSTCCRAAMRRRASTSPSRPSCGR